MGLWYQICLNLARVPILGLMRPVVESRELVPRRGGLLVASNHLSYWDPPLVAHALPRACHFVAKEELFGVPGLGPLIRSLGAIPIRRGAADLKGIQEAIAVLRSGGCLLIFPEGSRSQSGELQRARPGVGLLWSHARVPVLPVHLTGTNRDRQWLLRRETVRLRFGAPLGERELADGAAEGSRGAYQRIADRILAAVSALSSGAERPAAAPEPPPGEERSD